MAGFNVAKQKSVDRDGVLKRTKVCNKKMKNSYKKVVDYVNLRAYIP